MSGDAAGRLLLSLLAGRETADDGWCCGPVPQAVLERCRRVWKAGPPPLEAPHVVCLGRDAVPPSGLRFGLISADRIPPDPILDLILPGAATVVGPLPAGTGDLFGLRSVPTAGRVFLIGRWRPPR